MMYPQEMVIPMKQELIDAGFTSLEDSAHTENFIKKHGTTLIVVNSVCGCAASNARPAAKASLQNDKTPTNIGTVFAGVDNQAVNTAREFMMPFPPSSPCIALFKEGKLVHMLERHHIEGRIMEDISENLKQAYNEFC